MTGEEVSIYFNMFGITPDSVKHGNTDIVLLKFDYDKQVIDVIKSFRAVWSDSFKSWYVPRSKKLLIRIIKALAAVKDIDIVRNEIKALVRLLELKSYSKNTIKTYRDAFSSFLDYFSSKDCINITKQEIESYLLFLGKKKIWRVDHTHFNKCNKILLRAGYE